MRRRILLEEFKAAEPELYHLLFDVGVQPEVIKLVFASLGFDNKNTTNQGRPAGI